uniref:DUF538 domain-containing protein n=1 Tax=Ananas comosus var. bracteatus TaxID=296719 RepID=A0A6V7NLQ9_ANACO|nr:unnamed protein product [Ananas comosus var. bracteatus]
MGKVSPFLFLVVLVLVETLTLGTVSSSDSDSEASIHDVLRAHGLPGGLLPKGVASFSLDADTGLLDVELSQPCYAKYDGVDLAYFDRAVRGNLSFGALRGVEGLSQEELFVWLPVKGILVSDPSSGVILFDIGLAHKRLSRSVFEDPPECQPNSTAAQIAGDGEDAIRKGLVGRRDQLFQEQR